MFQILSRRSRLGLFFASLWFLPASLATDMHCKWTGDSKVSLRCHGPSLSLDDLGAAGTRGEWKYVDAAIIETSFGCAHSCFSLSKKVLCFLFFYFGVCVEWLHNTSCVKYIVSALLEEEINTLPKPLRTKQLLFQMSWFCFFFFFFGNIESHFTSPLTIARPMLRWSKSMHSQSTHSETVSMSALSITI